MLKDKKVAIVGYGVEGKSSAEYYKKHGAQVAVFDASKLDRSNIPKDVEVFDEQIDFNITGYDLVIRTPGLRPDKIYTEAEVSSATNEFLKMSPAPVIGVTGTKGKGTTSTLIYEILKAAGKSAYLVGNIGDPALDVLDELKSEDIVVYELSSFQLWDVNKSPHVAVILMIDVDHMDVHKNMDEYVEAKRQIVAFQTREDIAIYHPTNKHVAEIIKTARSLTKPFNSNHNCKTEGDKLVIDGKDIMPISEIKLVGEHNLENVCAAVTAAYIYTQDLPAIAKVLREFKGLNYRLQLIRELDGVKYYNDSYSTTPNSTIAALKAFSEPKTLIVGGYDKGSDYSSLISTILELKPKVVTIGMTGKTIKSKLSEADFEAEEASSLEEAVIKARSVTGDGGVVLLSPASASFDMFKNVKDRAEQFNKFVSQL